MKNTNLSVVRHQEEVARRWSLAIEALGLKRVEVARDLGVSAQRLNGWLNGGHPPPAFYLAEFARAHRLPLDWILMGDERALTVGAAERLGLASTATKSDG